MPYIYSKDVTYGSTDTGGRPGRPTDGGITVYKAKGNVVSYKITKDALDAINTEYSPHTTKDILDALNILAGMTNTIADYKLSKDKLESAKQHEIDILNRKQQADIDRTNINT